MNRYTTRIKKELDSSKNITYYDIEEHLKGELSINICYKDRCIINIILPKNYPFYPPRELNVNFKKVTYYMLGNNDIIRRYFNKRCLCCTSKLCAKNWNPIVKLTEICDEYDKFKDIINASNVIKFVEKKELLNEDVLNIIVSYI